MSDGFAVSEAIKAIRTTLLTNQAAALKSVGAARRHTRDAFFATIVFASIACALIGLGRWLIDSGNLEAGGGFQKVLVLIASLMALGSLIWFFLFLAAAVRLAVAKARTVSCCCGIHHRLFTGTTSYCCESCFLPFVIPSDVGPNPGVAVVSCPNCAVAFGTAGTGAASCANCGALVALSAGAAKAQASTPCSRCGAARATGSFFCGACGALTNGERAVRNVEELLFCDHQGFFAHAQGVVLEMRRSLAGTGTWLERISPLADLAPVFKYVAGTRAITQRPPEQAAAFVRDVSGLYAGLLTSAQDGVLAENIRDNLVWSNDSLGTRIHGVLTGTWLAEAWNPIIEQWAQSSGQRDWSALAWNAPIVPATAIGSTSASTTNQSAIRWRFTDSSGFAREARRIETALDAVASLRLEEARSASSTSRPS